MMPSPEPAGRSKLTPLRIGFSPPGAKATRFSTVTWPRGAGRSMRPTLWGVCLRQVFSRAQALRQAWKAAQCATVISTGARARAIRIEAAIMVPGEICCLTAR